MPADELARRLRAAACLPGTSATPAAWPCDPALLDWLRRMSYPGLYTWATEENLAFGIRSSHRARRETHRSPPPPT